MMRTDGRAETAETVETTAVRVAVAVAVASAEAVVVAEVAEVGWRNLRGRRSPL